MFLLRGLWIGAGLAVALWQGWIFPDLWQAALLKPVGEASLTGATFSDDTLALVKTVVRANQQTNTASAARSKAYIQARLADLEVDPDKVLAPTETSNEAHADIVKALAVWPAEPHLWAMLASNEVLRLQRAKEAAADLRLSYLVGEHEGSASAKRSILAVFLGPHLDPQTQALSIAEFDNMAQSRDAALHGLVALRIYNASPDAQPALLERLAQAPEQSRREIYRMLVASGLDLQVPGVEREAQRPWQ